MCLWRNCEADSWLTEDFWNLHGDHLLSCRFAIAFHCSLPWASLWARTFYVFFFCGEAKSFVSFCFILLDQVFLNLYRKKPCKCNNVLSFVLKTFLYNTYVASARFSKRFRYVGYASFACPIRQIQSGILDNSWKNLFELWAGILGVTVINNVAI